MAVRTTHHRIGADHFRCSLVAAVLLASVQHHFPPRDGNFVDVAPFTHLHARTRTIQDRPGGFWLLDPDERLASVRSEINAGRSQARRYVMVRQGEAARLSR